MNRGIPASEGFFFPGGGGSASPLTTKGDVYTYSTADARLAVGVNGTVLTADSSEATGLKYAVPAGGGDVLKVGTPVDNQIGVWTGDGTLEGTSGFTYDGSNFLMTGDIGSTGTRITKAWFTDLAVTNNIDASITGNAGTVTTITGLAPDTATTQATQPNITSAAALPWTGMKVGTDGEIPTFDASGNPAFVAVGTATHVLTSNGVGAAPTFQAAAGGGGASIFDAEVAPGGADYTTIGAAITAGKTSLLISGNTTETADITIPTNGLTMYVKKSVTIAMSVYQFNGTTATQNVFITFEDKMTSKITATAPTNATFYFTNSAAICSLDGGFLSAVLTDSFIEGCVTVVRNCYCDFDSGGQIAFNNTQGGSVFDNLVVDCNLTQEVISTAGSTNISNVHFTGSMNVSTQRMIDFNNVGRHSLVNVTSDATGVTVIDAVGFVVISNCNMPNQTLDLNSALGCTVSSSIFKKIDGTNVAGTNFSLSSVIATDAMTIAGDRNSFDGCKFLGGVTLTTNAQDTGFSNCQFGPYAGGSALTLTITAGALRTRVSNCMSDAALVDGGTASAISADTNTVY